MDFMKQAEEIYKNYQGKAHPSPFNDAVIAFLLLFVKILIAQKKAK